MKKKSYAAQIDDDAEIEAVRRDLALLDAMECDTHRNEPSHLLTIGNDGETGHGCNRNRRC